jgi:hypothetical protein
MRRALFVVAFSLLIALVALPAQADRLAKADRNDTKGPLDIARIVHKHLLGHPNVFVHKIVMQKRLRRRALHSTNQDSRRITVTFDVDRAKGYQCIGCITEREVLIFAKNGHIVARLYNHLGDPAKKLANLPVWRLTTARWRSRSGDVSFLANTSTSTTGESKLSTQGQGHRARAVIPVSTLPRTTTITCCGTSYRACNAGCASSQDG